MSDSAWSRAGAVSGVDKAAPEPLAAAMPRSGEVTTRSTPRKVEVGRIGESLPRPDGIPKVKGEFAFSSDLVVPGMLWGHTVRAPHAHARIHSVDVSEAVTLPGVHAVLTHADVPGEKRYGLEFIDQ